jgi:hypothetical protein
MTGYRTDIVYDDSENSLYCDEIQLFKRGKKIIAEVDFSSSSQLRKNTSRIKQGFDELYDNIQNIKEISCDGLSKKVSRHFKTLDSEPKIIRRYCLVILGERQHQFECVFSLSNNEFTITKR